MNTTLKHMLDRPAMEPTTPTSRRFNALSIPIDNLNLGLACQQITEMIYQSARDRRSRYVATVNVDFMVNALGVAGAQARHPELLDTLRAADLVTADGFPIVLLSKIMGTPLQARVTGADLVPALAEQSAREGLRMFLLGGRAEIAQLAAQTLQDRYRGLEIAGVESPMVYTEGEQLISYQEDDQRLIKCINESGADILLLGLGNPKQEQWFRRNRAQLRVPVSIGVGGTFEFIAGTVQRAPAALQRANLEWLYRITQDPLRLWKRYASGLLKLGMLLCRPLLLRAREILLQEITVGKKPPAAAPQWSRFSGPNQSVAATVRMPRVLLAADIQATLAAIKANRHRDTLHMLDFSATKRIRVAAMQAMFELGRYLSQGNSQTIHLGMSNSLRKQLGAWHLLDLFDKNYLLAHNLHAPLAAQQSARAPMRLYANDSALVMYLHGDLDAELLRRCGIEALLSQAQQGQRCIIDLRYAQLIDSSAVVCFHRLARSLAHRQLYFAGIQASARRMFRLPRLPANLQFVDDAKQHALMVAA